MQPAHYTKALILALLIVTCFIAWWEYFWRSKGYSISYNDDKILWAHKRKEAYKPLDQSTVFIGGSRIKFDLDIPTWQKLTGEQPVQLALVGTAPRLLLKDLARDKNFKGKVVIDVTEHAFFSIDTLRTERSAREGISYLRNETPTQKVSASINYFLESNLVFLEEGKFGLNNLLNELPMPNRQTIIVRPRVPKYMSMTSFERQSIFTSIFLADSGLQIKQIEFWNRNGRMNKDVPIKGDTLEAFFKQLKTSIDKIRSRGGLVVFVRPPSNGKYLEREKRDYPRGQYWDRLLEYTKTPGYHFSDYPAIANLDCPESSHLSPNAAIIYTKHLAQILKEKKAWTYQHP